MRSWARARELERYFQGFSWRKDTTRVGIPLGENTVVLFAGEDEKKGAVRLVVDGIKYQVNREGNQTTSPDSEGPAEADHQLHRRSRESGRRQDRAGQVLRKPAIDPGSGPNDHPSHSGPDQRGACAPA